MMILMPPVAPDSDQCERLLFLAFWCISRLEVVVVGQAGSGLVVEVVPAS